ncbi:MAG: Vms1/Ankzf1 family peptidyl-tRNA hydrolase [Dehalococcoidia bacterium]
MRELLRRLAEREPTDLPILSIYLDMRSEATGEAPGRRSGEIVLKDRLHELERILLPRGQGLDSVRADAQRIERYLAETYAPGVAGLAIFACAAQQLFETVEVGVPFENQTSVGPVPDLFQLARPLDEQETAVVALVDSNTVRLFVSRTGVLEERDGPDEESVSFQKRAMGGWSQARYRRHIDQHRTDFVSGAAVAIEHLMAQESAVRLILAGDEVALTPLRDALAPATAALATAVLRLDIRTPPDEVERDVAPVLAQAEADDAHTAADRLIDAVRGDGLGVVGLERTRAALMQGQVDVLLLDPAAPIDECIRNDLVRMTTVTDATIEVVDGHADLRHLGGVGAFLRYRSTDRDQVVAR